MQLLEENVSCSTKEAMLVELRVLPISGRVRG